MPANTYTVTFDAADISPGIYFYRLRTSNQAENEKMIKKLYYSTINNLACVSSQRFGNSPLLAAAW